MDNMSIVVEERLNDLFALLPATSDGFKPVYHFGDGIELNKFVIGRENQVYPLIYQTSTREEQQMKQNLVETRLEIFLAVQTTTDLYNTERWATSYRNVLLPLFENIHKAFIRSGIISSEWKYDIDKIPNYNRLEGKNGTLDILDVLRFRLNVIISGSCIQRFNFND